MNKTVSLIIGILALLNVVDSFWTNSTTQTMFRIEMNIWIYRLIWTAIASVLLYDYIKKRNDNKG